MCANVIKTNDGFSNFFSFSNGHFHFGAETEHITCNLWLYGGEIVNMKVHYIKKRLNYFHMNFLSYFFCKQL